MVQKKPYEEKIIVTTDLNLAAYLSANEISPLRIVSEGRNRKKVRFVFKNDEKVSVLAKDFHEGKAQGNVNTFSHHLEVVRDWMFTKLREEIGTKCLDW